MNIKIRWEKDGISGYGVLIDTFYTGENKSYNFCENRYNFKGVFAVILSERGAFFELPLHYVMASDSGY